jgi:hypothetical protein
VLIRLTNLFAHFINLVLKFLEERYCVEVLNFRDLLFFHCIDFIFFLINFLWQMTKTSADWYFKRLHHIKMGQLIHQHHSDNSSYFWLFHFNHIFQFKHVCLLLLVIGPYLLFNFQYFFQLLSLLLINFKLVN